MILHKHVVFNCSSLYIEEVVREHQLKHFKDSQLFPGVVLTDFESLFSYYIVKITFKLSQTHIHTVQRTDTNTVRLSSTRC